MREFGKEERKEKRERKICQIGQSPGEMQVHRGREGCKKD